MYNKFDPKTETEVKKVLHVRQKTRKNRGRREKGVLDYAAMIPNWMCSDIQRGRVDNFFDVVQAMKSRICWPGFLIQQG